MAGEHRSEYGDRECDRLNVLSGRIIGACIEVHRVLGPGLLESVYEECLAHELTLQGLSFRRQTALPLVYKGTSLDCGLRLDMVIEETIILELKSVESIHSIFEAQLLTYLKLAGLPLGLLINFNVPVLKEGIRRMINMKQEF